MSKAAQTAADAGRTTLAACRAHSDLNIFYAVIAILEGGTLGSDSFRDAERIITICKSASSKCLKRYDAALAAAKGAK